LFLINEDLDLISKEAADRRRTLRRKILYLSNHLPVEAYGQFVLSVIPFATHGLHPWLVSAKGNLLDSSPV
jgi:hypothetical protein